MRNLIFAGRALTLLLSVTILATAGSRAWADDRFALAVGQHGDLLVFGPKGDKVADLPVPTIAQAVTIDGTTAFQISYGRDVDDKLSAILSPNATQPADLHFTILGKSVDADKMAVVTLTFSNNLNSVSVDPGYIGVVQVNNSKIRHHDLGDLSPAVATNEPIHEAPSNEMPAPAPRVSPQMAPRDVTSEPAPSEPTGPGPASVTSMPVSDTSMASPGTPGAPSHLFWAEPVTGPNGVPPAVGLYQMKLIELQGDAVSVHLPGGEFRNATDGMVIPSGSVITTGEDSSVAVFMGGINSIRLLPNSEIAITHHLEGSVRHTYIDLHRGTAFSRIGRRDGEKQDYEVRTPEGTAIAKGTNIADSYFNGHHYVFIVKGTVGLFVANQFLQDISGNGGGGIGMGSMPPANDEAQVLRSILLALQPFNLKTNAIVLHIQQGTASPGELAFYTAMIYDALLNEGFPPGHRTYLAAEVGAGVTVALHDLVPFESPEATPH
jgi:hypothetical protein